MIACERYDEVRDYALGELPGAGAARLEQHLKVCPECSGEVDRLRITTASLRLLPDSEIPQRIAFVSDKVFEASPVSRWFSGFWNSAARLGFASACVLSVGLVVASRHDGMFTPAPVPVARVRTASTVVPVDLSAQVNDAVAKAVERVRTEDARLLSAALDASESRHEREHRALMVAMEENLTVLQKRLSTYNMLASSEIRPGFVQ